MKISNVLLNTRKERPFWDIMAELKRDKSIDYCIKNKDLIIELISKYPEVYVEKRLNQLRDLYYERRNSHLSNNKIFDEVVNGIPHFCLCGTRLRLVPKFNFIGCPNYRDTTQEHKSFGYYKIDEFNPDNFRVDFSMNYLTDFKNEFNLPEFLMTSILFSFLYRVWNLKPLVDINEEYFNTGKRNSQRSKNEEAVIEKYLNLIYDKVSYQPNFIVTFEDGRKDLKIPDFICGNPNEVILVEVKKNVTLLDVEKLDYYRMIVEKFMEQNTDKRTLNQCTIFYEYENYNKVNESNSLFHVSNIFNYLPIIK